MMNLTSRLQQLYEGNCPPENPCTDEQIRRARDYLNRIGQWPPPIPRLSYRLPKLIERVWTFIKAVTKALIHGLPWVSPQVYAEREEHCTPCEWRTKEGKCSKCGCGTANRGMTWLLDKLWWALERCPVGKWGPVKGETIFARVLRWWRDPLDLESKTLPLPMYEPEKQPEKKEQEPAQV